jgi:hypothetical protein
MEVEIGNVDWKKLREQKDILISMIQDWGESDDPDQRRDAEEVEGILNLIDRIQDDAVDRLGISSTEVFNF